VRESAVSSGIPITERLAEEERTCGRVARFGPTTPTRAGRLADASVDHTEARKATVRCFGRSDRRPQ
jgi:hypothetical protein